MKVTIQIHEYDRVEGVRGTWIDGFEIEVRVDDGDVVIVANKEGLLSLAANLATLAQDNVPSSHHFHLDPGYGVELNSNSLILERK